MIEKSSIIQSHRTIHMFTSLKTNLMRTYLFSGVILFLGATLLFFSSCEKENNIALPVVKITELGSGHDSANDKTAFAGRGAHLEVEIIADGLIKEIVVDVHQEEGDFKIIKTYGDSKYVGAKNAIFHEHLSIPAEEIGRAHV